MEHNINDDKSSGKNIAINDRTIANIKRQLKNKKTQMLQDYNYIKKGVKNNKYLQVAIDNYKVFFNNELLNINKKIDALSNLLKIIEDDSDRFLILREIKFLKKEKKLFKV